MSPLALGGRVIKVYSLEGRYSGTAFDWRDIEAALALPADCRR